MRGELTANELRQTEENVIKEAQYESYPEEIDALFKAKQKPSKKEFNPYIHSDDLYGRTV